MSRNLATVYFELQSTDISPEFQFKIVGNTKELGNWQPDKGCLLFHKHENVLQTEAILIPQRKTLSPQLPGRKSRHSSPPHNFHTRI